MFSSRKNEEIAIAHSRLPQTFFPPSHSPPKKISVWDIRSSINNCDILWARTKKNCVLSQAHENKYSAAKKHSVCMWNKMKNISVMCCFQPFLFSQVFLLFSSCLLEALPCLDFCAHYKRRVFKWFGATSNSLQTLPRYFSSWPAMKKS